MDIKGLLGTCVEIYSFFSLLAASFAFSLLAAALSSDLADKTKKKENS